MNGLRNTLQAAVARCTRQEMQPATAAPAGATGRATAVQRIVPFPSRGPATHGATGAQLGSCTAPAVAHALRPRSCARCVHFSRKRTCLRPVAAGLAEYFMLIWPEPGQAVSCPAFEPKPTSCTLHAPGDATRNSTAPTDWIALARSEFAKRGTPPTAKTDETPISSVSSVAPPAVCKGDAEVSSVSSVGVPPLLRHIGDPDRRVVCVRCRNYTAAFNRCGDYRAAGLLTGIVGPALARLPQHCPAFIARKDTQ